MKKILNFCEQSFTVVSLLHYTGGPLAVILSGGASEGDNSIVEPDYALIQLLFFINFAISFFLLVIRWKKVIKLINKERYITVLVGLCFISFFWSAAPTVTLVRSVAILGTSLFGVYLATRYTLEEQLQLLALTFGIAIILSLLFILGLPKYGIMAGLHAGKWRGIYVHKNVLGKLMVLSTLIFLITALNRDKNKLFCIGGLLFSIFLLLMCKSSSSLVNLLILLMTFLVISTLILRYEVLFPVLFFLAIVGTVSYLWLTNNAEIILSSMGKDSSLTGRTPLWNAVLDMIWQRPWLGYGFSGFWGGWDRDGAYVWRLTGWTPPNAHNGLLDLWLDLGFLGLSIYLLGFIINLFKSLAWVRKNRTAVSFWPVMYIIYFWLSNQTESALLRQNEIYWLLYVTVILSMLIPQEGVKNKSVKFL